MIFVSRLYKLFFAIAFPPACRPSRVVQDFHPPPSAVECLHHRDQRPKFQIEPEDCSYSFGFLLIHYEATTSRSNVVAKYGISANPLAFAPGGTHLVASPLRDHFPLELGKREQDVQGQAPHGTGRIELLCQRNKGGAVFIENFHGPRKVERGSRKAVHFVDHDAIHSSSFDIGKKSFQCWAIHFSTCIFEPRRVNRQGEEGTGPIHPNVVTTPIAAANAHREVCNY